MHSNCWHVSLKVCHTHLWGFSVKHNRCADLSKNPPEGISVGLKDDNLFHWTVLLVGPPGTY